MRTRTFERLAAYAAFLVAAGALLYAALFVAIVEGAGTRTVEWWFFTLMVGAILTVPVLVAVYLRLCETDLGLALTALVLGLWAAFGGVEHGAYGIGVLIHPVARRTYPSPEAISHGVLRYLAGGLSLLVIGWASQRGRAFPALVAYLAYAGAAALVFIYVGRVFDFIRPSHKISLLPPELYGFVLFPLYYVLLGRELLRGHDT